MQLPRGKFRSVIKGVAANSLILELAELRYSGHIAFTREKVAVVLVIQKGRYILAEYGPMKGDQAWEGISTLGEVSIDAILTDLTDTELKLAIEFNEPSIISTQIVTRAFRAPREKAREPAPAEAAASAPIRQAVAAPVRQAPAAPQAATGLMEAPGAPAGVTAPEGPAVLAAGIPPEPLQAWKKPDATPAAPRAAEKASGELTTPGYDELSLLHMEMSALDDVDVEHIATKIRKNARGIVKKLHLGHLMPEKDEGGSGHDN